MEATVEVLTAEVRTLMVGSRQVTLSVYRQLDEVDIFETVLSDATFVPFGRVRSGTKYNDLDRRDMPVKREARAEFVGMRVSDGSLARVVVLPGDYPLSDEETARTISAWEETLPLIVLAGLR